ncbi:MAG: DUF433 domain-containing protein [Flavobacteriales bacterium]
MNMATDRQIISPQLGQGIYLVKDVAKILHLNYDHVRRWIVGYWSGSLQKEYNYTFGEDGSKAINFYSLIEFYTFYKLREKKISAQEIRILHDRLSKLLKTPYPFAMAQDFYIDKRKKKNFVYFSYIESLIKHDSKLQFSLKFVQDFLDKVEFDDNNLARRFYPLNNSKNVVVDPGHQFGQPIVAGTNIKTQAIFNLHKAGEPIDNICALYDISEEKAMDAIRFHKNAA